MSEQNRKQTFRMPRGPLGRGGPMHGMMPGAKARDFKGSMGKLIGYLGGYKWTILLVWLIAVASVVFTVLGPRILGQATDELFSGVMKLLAGTGTVDFGRIGGILLGLAGLYGMSALLSYTQGFLMSGITAKVTLRLRSDINDKMHRLPLGYYDTTTHGDVLSRITNDVDAISQSMSQSITQMITSVTSVVGMAVMMFTISWRLTLTALCVLPLSMLAVTLIVKKSQKHFKRQQETLGSVNGHVEEMFGGHVVVKAFGGEAESLKTFGGYNDALYESAWKSHFLSGLMMPITSFIGNLAYVAICILGGYYAAGGMMTIGGIQAFIQYMRQFTHPVAQLANISNVLQQTAAASERVFEFLEAEEEVPEPGDAAARPDEDGDIVFDRVSFGDSPDKIIVRDFSARVQPGQKIAIVGPTGAGKTTIVKLLMRFYDVNSGAITIGGQDIRLFKRNDLRSLFGMVLQDAWLFSGTIADNIRYGNLAAGDEEVKNAAVSAQVDHFVRTLSDGYQTVLNEEADNISEGQKQLLTIARAILADPDILILDEATSSVDTRTEQMIQKAMDHLMKGRTSFVIAHRLSTVRNADLILVMRDGDIVEQGTHAELLQKGGFYAGLYNSQFETAG